MIIYIKNYIFSLYMKLYLKTKTFFYNLALQQLGLINIFIDKVNLKNICNNKHFNDKVNSAIEIKNLKIRI